MYICTLSFPACNVLEEFYFFKYFYIHFTYMTEEFIVPIKLIHNILNKITFTEWENCISQHADNHLHRYNDVCKQIRVRTLLNLCGFIYLHASIYF